MSEQERERTSVQAALLGWSGKSVRVLGLLGRAEELTDDGSQHSTVLSERVTERSTSRGPQCLLFLLHALCAILCYAVSIGSVTSAAASALQSVSQSVSQLDRLLAMDERTNEWMERCRMIYSRRQYNATNINAMYSL